MITFAEENKQYLAFKDAMKSRAEKYISKFDLTVRDDGDSRYYFFTALASILYYTPEDLEVLTYEDVIKSIDISIKAQNGLSDRWVNYSEIKVKDIDNQLCIYDNKYHEELTDIVNVVHNDVVAICFGDNSYVAIAKLDEDADVLEEKIYYVD